MSEPNKKLRLAYLSDVLYVPAEHVTREHIDAFTYKFEKPVYERPDNVVRKCLNCKYWRVPWKDYNGTDVLCHLKGYTESDYCKKFDPKPIKRIEEIEIVTYAKPNQDYYTFGRGDLGKIENVFNNFQIVDQRSSKPLDIDLQLKAGRTLYPEQVKIIQDWLEHGYGIIKAPTGMGKCLISLTYLNTNKGLLQIGKLVDSLLGNDYRTYDGYQFKSISDLGLKATASGYSGDIVAACRKRSTTLKITTQWGYNIEVTPEHPLLAMRDGKPLWIEASKLTTEDTIAIRGLEFRLDQEPFEGDLASFRDKGLTVPDSLTPQLSRLLGALIADGGISNSSLNYTKTDKVNVQDVREALNNLGLILQLSLNRTVSYVIKSAGALHLIKHFRDFLEFIGVTLATSRYKKVPAVIFTASKDNIRNFLQGYFSGDGLVDPRKGTVECCSASLTLIQELQMLLLGFGIPSICHLKPVKLKGWEESRDYWVLVISRVFTKIFRDNIGFLPGSDRDILLIKTIEAFEGKNPNGNEFCLPVAKLIREAYNEFIKEKLPKTYKRSLNFKYIWEKDSRVDPATILKFLNTYPDGSHLQSWKNLKEIYDNTVNNCVWFPAIKSIEPGEEQWVYDLTVTKDHWYVANGIVSHNTVMWTYLVSHLKMKTILLAQEVRHLQVGFEGLYEHTNIADLEKEAGTNLCGRLGYDHYFDSSGKAIFKKSKDPGKTYPVTFSTFQALNSTKGKELLSTTLKDEFGLMWLEECLIGSTLIPTTKGIIRLDSLGTNESRDLYIDVGSRFGVASTQRWIYNGTKPTLKVETTRGHTYIGTPDHKMLVLKPDNFELIWVATKDIKKDDLLCISPKKVVRKEKLPLPIKEGTKHPIEMTEELAFIIGTMLSIGTVRKASITITTKHNDLVTKLERYFMLCFGLSTNTRIKYPEGPKNNKHYLRNKDYWLLSISNKKVINWLRLIGVSNIPHKNKVIPWSILQANEGSQLAFLAGCIKSKTKLTKIVSIRNPSREFLHQIVVLLQSHGYHSAWIPLHGRSVRLSQGDSFKISEACVSHFLYKNKIKVVDCVDLNHNIPTHSFQKLINDRRITSNKFQTYKGSLIKIKNSKRLMKKVDKLINIPYYLINSSKYKEVLDLVKVLDPDLYYRFETLEDLKYRFVKVKSVVVSDNQTVYDLTMKDPNNRSFIANGLISSNCHHEAAETFHNVTKSFTSYYKGGQTATPTRKDNTHVAMYDTIGPVTAIGTKEQLICQYMFINTGVFVSDRVFYGQYPLPKLFNFIATNTHIQECILQWILYDIQQGRKPLYITERKADAFSLRDKIHMSGYNVELIMGGSESKKQSEYSNRLIDGSLHAIIGTKVIKENYNIPPLDTLHLAYPNFGVESEEQMTGRIRRYLRDDEGNLLHKNQPMIRVYMVESNNSMIKKSKEFRRSFYKKMSFEEVALNSNTTETEISTIKKLKL